MTIQQVHHLNCATMCPAFGRFLGQADAGMFGRGHMVAHCLLVETARDGLVLIDTGFGTRDLEGKTGIPKLFHRLVGPTFDPREPAIAQVEALGHRAEDVRHIVVTHLDLDHAGGLGDFPNARVHLHAREHAAAITRSSLRERERYMTDHWAHGPRWEVYAEDGDTWRGLPSVNKLRGVDADIALVPLHGHTRGHSAIAVRTGERWLVHAGDAYFHRDAIKGSGKSPAGFALFERAAQIDGTKRRASVAALRQLHASYGDLDIFCAHDPSELDELTARTARHN